jgi:hypothetical protein
MQLLSGGKRAPNRLVIGPAIFSRFKTKFHTYFFLIFPFVPLSRVIEFSNFSTCRVFVVLWFTKLATISIAVTVNVIFFRKTGSWRETTSLDTKVIHTTEI